MAKIIITTSSPSTKSSSLSLSPLRERAIRQMIVAIIAMIEDGHWLKTKHLERQITRQVVLAITNCQEMWQYASKQQRLSGEITPPLIDVLLDLGLERDQVEEFSREIQLIAARDRYERARSSKAPLAAIYIWRQLIDQLSLS